MESACVYEQKTVIHELSEGIQMAKQLRFNLNSGESREFLIHKILSSYENALFVLKSGDFAGQPQPTALPAHSLPESSISIGSPKIGEFEFEQPFIYQQGQNAVSKERKEPHGMIKLQCVETIMDLKPHTMGDMSASMALSWRHHHQPTTTTTTSTNCHPYIPVRCSQIKEPISVSTSRTLVTLFHLHFPSLQRH